MPSAARITDMHTCTITGSGVVPHIGGPIIGPGVANVLIGNMPAAVVGDALVCIGSSDTIVKGSTTVLIAGKSAVRQGDITAHGGIITTGLASVQVGG